MFSRISNRTIIEIVLLVWITVAALYVSHVPGDHCTDDLGNHIDYTEIVALQKCFPTPYERFETFQPPLYYLINSLLVPKQIIMNDRNAHLNFVRIISVFYGAFILLILLWVLNQQKLDQTSKLVLLLFIATTPLFAFLFTTYNNDSLANLCSIGILATSYRLYKNWSTKWALVLLITTTCALYTKYTTMIPIFSVVIICCKNLLKFNFPKSNQLKIILIFLFSFILLLPWLILHNLPLSGKLFPTNYEISTPYDWSNFKRYLKIVSPLAIFSGLEHKWETPFNHYRGDSPATKKFDYWTYIFIFSVTHGAGFKTPDVKVVWIIIIFHLLMYLIALSQIFKNNLNKAAGWCILCAHLATIANFVLYHAHFPFETYAATNPTITYRYIVWERIAWIILYASAFSTFQPDLKSLMTKSLFFITIIQIYFLILVTGCG